MSFEELAAKLGLTPEQAAELKAAMGGGEAARAADAPAAPAPVAAAAPAVDPALRSLQASFEAFKAKSEKAATEQEETALINEQIKRDAALPAEEPLMRLALRARAADGGAAWKLFTDRPNGHAYRAAGASGVTGQRPAAAGQANDKTPPTDRNGFAAFALRNAKEGEHPAEALARCRREHPAQSAEAFGDRGFVADPFALEVTFK